MAGSSATSSNRDARQLAERTASAFARYEDIRGIVLVGSVARGDEQPDSDLDLVVVTADPLRHSELLGRLSPGLRDDRLSLLPFSVEQWLEDAADSLLFIHHVALEGDVLLDRDGVVQRGFALVRAQPPDVERELRRQVARLRLYREPKRFNGEHLFALSRLYAIGKAVAIARCAELGETTFVKEEALQRLARQRPALADDVFTIRRLRPFYDLTREREPAPLPFDPIDVDDEIVRASRSIERIAHG